MADDLKRRFARTDNAYGGAAPERAPSSDPLAELARLIGQDDVFDQMRRDASRPDGRTSSEAVAPKPRAPYQVAAAAQRVPGYDAVPDTQADYAARIYGRDHQPAVNKSAASADTAVYGEPYYADGPADPYPTPPHDALHDGGYDEHYEEAPEAQPVERRRSGFAIAAAVVGIAVVGTAGAFGYRAMTGGGGDNAAPPVISADKTPAKIVPAPSAGDGQAGKVGFDRNEKAQGERVVTREEQPIEMRETKAPSPKMLGPTITGTTGIGAPAQGAAPLGSSAMQPLPANPNEPKKVRTFAIRPDGSLVSEPPKPQGAGSTRSNAPIQNTPPRPNSAPRPGASLPGQGALAMASTGDAVRPAVGAPTQTASIRPLETPVTRAPIANGSHVVQLASQKSEIEAQASFRSLQAKYPGVLAGRQPLIRRVELGERGTYYRAQVGPFASADQANELCSNLKAAGGQCIVQRN